jgi:hypothetical protein
MTPRRREKDLMDNTAIFPRADAYLTPRVIVWVELLHFEDHGASVDELVEHMRQGQHVDEAIHGVATITDVVGTLLEELVNAKVGSRYAQRLPDGRYRAMPGLKAPDRQPSP